MPNSQSSDVSLELQKTIAPYIENGSVPGAVAVVLDRQEILGQVAIGYSDVAKRRPMQLDTYFWIASMTKPITATAFCMLLDEGKVSLDDPVDQYLPGFSTMWVTSELSEDRMVLTKAKSRITVRQILSHTSGMPFQSEIEAPTRDLLELAVSVRCYAATPLLSEPGTRYEYSNAGINTAARILEVVTGIAYETFLQERIFDPLKMTDTTFFPNESQIARLTKAYQPNPDGTAMEEIQIPQLHHPLNSPVRRPIPGGGLFSSAKDITAFAQMILNGGISGGRRFVSQHVITLMSTRQTPAHLEESYGLGWFVGQDNFEHGGAFSTSMAIYPKDGFAVLLLLQQNAFIRNGDQCRGEVESRTKRLLGRRTRIA